MPINKVEVTAIDFNTLQPEDVFKWLELFSFKRYGERHFVDHKKADDPRYPAEYVTTPPTWSTFLHVTDNCYDRTMVIIDEEMYEKIKAHFEARLKTNG